MIYLASPYSHPEKEVRELRFRQTLSFCYPYIIGGTPLYSPIVYGHQFTELLSAPFDAASWQDFNERMLSDAKELWVLKLPGWSASFGIGLEIAFCKTFNKPIYYKEPSNENTQRDAIGPGSAGNSYE